MVRVFSSVGAAVSLRFLGLGDSFRAIVDVCLLDHGVALGEDSTTNKISSCCVDIFSQPSTFFNPEDTTSHAFLLD